MNTRYATTIGVDVGGTFTDVVLSDGISIWTAKVPTTSDDPALGVVNGCELVATRAGFVLSELLPTVRRFGLGTTQITNIIATRSGRRVGLLTTKGFEYSLQEGRSRMVAEDGWLVQPAALVDPADIEGIDERIGRGGVVVRPIDPDEVQAAGSRLVASGVDAIAVSFLWSFANPEHENLAVRLLSEAHPKVDVVSGSRLLPVMREFERTAFAVLNAYTSGALDSVEALQSKLTAAGLAVPVLLVHSGGGAISISEARYTPASLIESGPAAGVAAALTVARSAGADAAVTCDMGGTSFDVSIISGGHPARRSRGEVMGQWTALSMVDVDSIGAGGGSIAWIDRRSMLRVGPRSAGSVPGPACYGRGGSEPTVTDALLVLGYLHPKRFLGGSMLLNVASAAVACESIADQLGLDVEEAAWGIREIALVEMARAIRSRVTNLGLDPREQTIISYGGCGGLFAADIAAASQIPRVLIPRLAPVLSAFGAASADIRRERTRTLSLTLTDVEQNVEKIADELRALVDDDLAADGVTSPDRRVTFEADMRFRRQSSELTIPLPAGPLDRETLERATREFKDEYVRRFGAGAVTLGVPTELAVLRAIGIGHTPRATLGASIVSDSRLDQVQQRERRVRTSRDTSTPTPVYAFADLNASNVLEGPALIDSADTTIWVPSRFNARLETNTMTLILEAAE